jgi:hypothetical protein
MTSALISKETARDLLIEQNILDALSVLADSSSGQNLEKSACLIADVFGAGGKFSGFITEKNPQRDALEERLVEKFHKNLRLLIKKSWVEKYDEALKEQVLCRLEKFYNQIEQCDYSGAYAVFLEVITDTVYLMFGPQSKKDDFTEYAMRIDPEFGIFWLYVKALAADSTGDNERCRLMLLLGIVFLANY